MELYYIRVERELKQWLKDNEINYLFLTYTDCYEKLISVTFDIELDLNLFLDLIKYRSKFNKSQYIIIPETKTILIQGDSANEIIRNVRGIYSSKVSR